MKKLLLAALLVGFAYFGANAQTSPGNSAFGHSHKKLKHTHRPYTATRHIDADRRAINVQHRTIVRTVRRDEDLTNRQQREQVKQANVTHRDNMKMESHENVKMEAHSNGNGNGKGNGKGK